MREETLLVILQLLLVLKPQETISNGWTTAGRKHYSNKRYRAVCQVRDAPPTSSTKTHQSLPYPTHQTHKWSVPWGQGHVWAPSVLKSPDSGEQSCATGSSAAIHSQTPSARASRGETRAGKRGWQMNQEATARTTFRIPQSHLTLSQAINSVETHRRHLITEHKALLAVNEDTNYCHT